MLSFMSFVSLDEPQVENHLPCESCA